MAKTARPTLTVPKGLDEKLIRSRYEATLGAREKRFKADFDRFSQLQNLKINASARAARAAGTKQVPASKETVANAKQIVATLHRFQPDVPTHFPPNVPNAPILTSFPYTAAVPLAYSSNGGASFQPWDGAPNLATGQVGGILGTWSGGGAMTQSAVGFTAWVPTSGDYEVLVEATMRGVYYVEAPAYGVAEIEVDLFAEFIDEVPEPSASYQASSNILSVGTPFFAAATEWNFITNPPPNFRSFSRTFTFPMGDAPGPVQVNAGVTQKIVATPGAIATVDVEMTILSIGLARIG